MGHRQIAYMAWRRLKPLIWPYRSTAPPPLHLAPTAIPRVAFLFPTYDGTAQDIHAGRWRFINQSAKIGFPPKWHVNRSMLWQYNLHYFDYIHRLDEDTARHLVHDWIQNYPISIHAHGWTPYPTSLRLRNWVKYFYLDPNRHAPLKGEIPSSLLTQLHYLSNHIEYQYQANHLLENLMTVYFLHACFKHPFIERCYQKTRAQFLHELDEQILPDGGHIERSVMYHSLILVTLLDILNVTPPSSTSDYKILHTHATRMAQFLADMRHPDGEISLFNDAAIGIAPSPGDILAYASILDIPIHPRRHCAYANTGYYSYRQSLTTIMVDAAPIGPDYVPAHAHGDIFSFEMSVNGHRFITDRGTSTYSEGPERDEIRSTRTHNTVTIANKNQCTFWGAFRVARRGRPFDVSYKNLPNGFWLTGAHNGYRHLRGHPIHHRAFRFHDPDILVIWDNILSTHPHPIEGYLHFAPGVTLTLRDPRHCECQWPYTPYTITFMPSVHLAIESSLYSPHFSTTLSRSAIRYTIPHINHPTPFCIAPSDRHVEFDTEGRCHIDQKIVLECVSKF